MREACKCEKLYCNLKDAGIGLDNEDLDIVPGKTIGGSERICRTFIPLFAHCRPTMSMTSTAGSRYEFYVLVVIKASPQVNISDC